MITLRARRAIADTKVVELKEDPNGWYQFKSEQTIELAELDAVLMRKDPPFGHGIHLRHYILERRRTRHLNRQQATKPTIVTRNSLPLGSRVDANHHGDAQSRKIKTFREAWRHHPKPLDGMGGASIFQSKRTIRTSRDHRNLDQSRTKLRDGASLYCQTISNNGDKAYFGGRLASANALLFAAASQPKRETRGNLAAGGRG